MADFNEILGKVGELSDEELSTHRQSALDEFNELKDAESTEENVTRLTEIADFVSTLKDEETAREARAAELAEQANDAVSRITELTATPEEEEDVVVEEESDEDAPLEEVLEDEEEKDFAASDDKDEDKPEDTEEDEEEKKEKAEKPFSDDSEEAAELSTETPEELASEDKAEDKAEADAEATENKDNEEDHLFTENTEENNVASTPEELSVQDAPESKSAGLEVTITAGADIPGYGLGAELDDLAQVSRAFSERLRAIGTRGTGNGEQHTVASFNINYPDDRKLVQGDRLVNESRMNAVASPKAVVAAGGICAPLPIDEELITYGSTDRPVRDSLPRFNAERGGVIYLTPPSLADVDGAVSIWTLEDDYKAIGATLPTGGILPGEVPARDTALDGTLGTSVYPGAINGTGTDQTGPVKPSIRITCGDEIRAYVDAIPAIFTVGNMQARAYPELIEKHLELAMVWQARAGEQRLLTRMGNLSTKVRTKATHGITRDFLNGLSVAVAGFRSRHRLGNDFKFRAILPIWFRDAIRADMLLQIAGDGQDATFGLTDATIDRWISERGVNVTWTLDGEVSGPDGYGKSQYFTNPYATGSPTLSGADVEPGTEEAIEEFPDEVVWYLFPEGGFVFLDGGTLDLGIVRDSVLNSKNDYQIFVETFEGLIKRAPETFRVTTPLNILGATTGTVDPVVGS